MQEFIYAKPCTRNIPQGEWACVLFGINSSIITIEPFELFEQTTKCLKNILKKIYSKEYILKKYCIYFLLNFLFICIFLQNLGGGGT